MIWHDCRLFLASNNSALLLLQRFLFEAHELFAFKDIPWHDHIYRWLYSKNQISSFYVYSNSSRRSFFYTIPPPVGVPSPLRQHFPSVPPDDGNGIVQLLEDSI
jgi:hypothetical protein